MACGYVASQNFYQSYQILSLDIKTQETLVRSFEKELDQIIKKSGPVNVRAVAYDAVPGVSQIVPDTAILERIQYLTAMISINRSVLEEKRQALREMKKAIQKVADEMGDKELKVFLAAWFEGKDISVIASEMYLSIQSVKWYKTKIYQKLESAPA